MHSIVEQIRFGTQPLKLKNLEFPNKPATVSSGSFRAQGKDGAMPEPKAKHTPGQWIILHGTNIFGTRLDTGHRGIVCNTGGHESNQVDCGIENRANAHLIAAVPELLEACKALLGIDNAPAGDPEHIDWYAATQMGRSAVAKATEERVEP